MKKAMGCLLRGTILLVMLGVIGAIIVSFLDSDDTDTQQVSALISIVGAENWTASGEGCEGTGQTAAWVNADSPVSMVPSTDDSRGDTQSLGLGVMFDDGSCQFAFSQDSPVADSYRIHIGGNSTVCEVSEMATSDDGPIADVIVDSNGMSCRVVSD